MGDEFLLQCAASKATAQRGYRKPPGNALRVPYLGQRVDAVGNEVVCTFAVLTIDGKRFRPPLKFRREVSSVSHA